MPKAVTQYETFDGKVFSDENAAEQWERNTNKANAIISMFPNNGHLSSGDFYQLSRDLISTARIKLADALTRGGFDDEMIKAFRDNTSDVIGRYLDDGGSTYYKAWWLFSCIDNQGRMFNQPFFANNPREIRDEVSY